jgi:hypothetical protein
VVHAITAGAPTKVAGIEEDTDTGDLPA